MTRERKAQQTQWISWPLFHHLDLALVWSRMEPRAGSPNHPILTSHPASRTVLSLAGAASTVAFVSCPPLRLKGGPGPMVLSALPSPSRRPSDTRQPREVSSIPGDETSRAELEWLKQQTFVSHSTGSYNFKIKGQQCSVKNTWVVPRDSIEGGMGMV